MGKGFLEFWLDGSLTHSYQACYGKEQVSGIYADNANWHPCMSTEEKTCPEDDSETQIVISENAASCMLYSIAASSVGSLVLDTTRVNEMFSLTRSDAITMDTRYLGKYLTIIRSRFRSNTPVTMNLSFGNPEVTFEPGRVTVDYSVGMQLKENNSKEFFYDEIKMKTQIDLSASNDEV